MAKTFPYRVDRRFLPLLAVVGFRPSHDGVTIGDDGILTARLGFVKVSTPVANVNGAHVTRGYRWWRSVGTRLSFADDGLTLGTNGEAGVCIHFGEKVKSLIGPKGHSAVTVTVEDLDGLVAALVSP